MQPYLFPYIGYFQLMHAVDRFVVYDDVAFIKQGWINRNRLLVNGHPSYFSVPVKHASSFAPICATLIDDDPQHTHWVRNMLRTFANAYRRAPQFPRIFPIVEAVFTRPTNQVADLAAASLRAVAELLEIRAEWIDSSSRYGNAHLKGEDRVLAICRLERATDYINAAGGLEMYSRERFEEEGIQLRFLRSRPIEYRQFGRPFVPSLSIIDVLMFNPRDTVRALLDSYDLA